MLIKTKTKTRCKRQLLDQRAELLALTDSPKEWLWKITHDGYEDLGAPKGTTCLLQHRPAKYGEDLVLILINNNHCNKWLFGILLSDGTHDYLCRPVGARVILLVEGTYTLCGVLAPMLPFAHTAGDLRASN